jgi:hypothetical protein
MREFIYISKENKEYIINERLMALENTLYDLEVGLIQENARENVISENVTNITLEIAETNRCIDALKICLENLN